MAIRATLAHRMTALAAGLSVALVVTAAHGATMYIVTDLGALPGRRDSEAYGINNAGQVVGRSCGGNGLDHAFLYSGSGPMQDLGTLPGAQWSVAHGINNAGQVVGRSRGGNGVDHAFLYSGSGPMQDLGTLPGGQWSQAFGINNAGQVVGYSYSSSGQIHAFLYSGSGPMQDLGTLPGGSWSWAHGINNAGQVVGDSDIVGSGTNIHAFVYTGSGPMADLNDLTAGTFISGARAINDYGKIAANGGHTAVLLTPVNKYKQGDYGLAEPAPWGGNGKDGQAPPTLINPAFPDGPGRKPYFYQSGCTVTSLATAVSLFGINKDPTQMSQWITSAKLWSGGTGHVTVGSVWINRDDGTRISAVRHSAGGFGFNDIVAQLRQSRPVLLAVPSLGGDNPNGNLHYIVAFGLAARGTSRFWPAGPAFSPAFSRAEFRKTDFCHGLLATSAPSTGAVDPSQIFISDPGGGTGTYSLDDTAVAPVHHLTLAQYFSILDSGKPGHPSTSRAGTVCQDWFNAGKYYDNGALQTVGTSTLPKLITEFTDGATATNSSITVQSPVELIITDPTSGQRYASSVSVAQPGDTVLPRILADVPDDVTETDPVLTTDPFPAYSLMLPNALYGKSIDLTIIGVGSGPYEVDYQPGTGRLQASAALTGLINDGDIVVGHFDVTAVPEPSAALLLALGAAGLMDCRPKRRTTCCHETL